MTGREVIEWPSPGSARRYPVGGWWVVERGPGGLTPISGPHPTKAVAEGHLEDVTPAWKKAVDHE